MKLSQFKKLTRASSLEGLTTKDSRKPCMVAMPPTIEYDELGDSFERLPENSWILPFIIACAPNYLRRILFDLPNISLKILFIFKLLLLIIFW